MLYKYKTTKLKQETEPIKKIQSLVYVHVNKSKFKFFCFFVVIVFFVFRSANFRVTFSQHK